MEVLWVSACKADASKVVKSLHIVEIGIYVVTEPVVVLSRVPDEAVLDILVFHIAPCYWHL